MSRSGLRVLTVLDALERAGTPRTAAQIARATSLPEATAWRMLQTLAEWGGVERNPDGAYRITTRLWAVGASAPCVRRLQRDTHRHLQALHDVTGMTTALSVYDGCEAIIVSTAGERYGPQEGDRITVAPDGPGLGRLLAATRDLGTYTEPSPVMSEHETMTITRGIADPSGAIVAAITLTAPSSASAYAAASRALDDALPRIRFSIYQDELFT